MNHLQATLQKLKENKLFAKLSKCDFGKTKIEYLGHVINGADVSAEENKIKSMRAWPPPKTLKN